MGERWTAAENSVLRALYADGIPVRLIAARLGRSEAAVSERRRAVGMPARRLGRPWSPREDDLVLAGAARGLPATALTKVLGRSAEELQRRKRTLTGTRQERTAFSPAEDAVLAREWRSASPEELAARLSRSAAVVRARARKLGLYQPPQRFRWTPEEDAIVREGYAQARGCRQISDQLRGRSPAAVSTRAGKLGLVVHARGWNSREDRLLADLCRAGMEPARIATRLGRTPDALRARARRLGVPLPASRQIGQRGRHWSAADDALLRAHHAQNPAVAAELLARTP